MIAQNYSATNNGLRGVPVTVEVEITNGIGIHLVGLADAAVKESLLRTATALQSLGYSIPDKKIIINIAPADLRKSGCGYDLPISLGIVSASEQEHLPDLDKYVIAGELGLDGSLRDIPGWMQCAELALSQGKACIMPVESAKKAARAIGKPAPIYGAEDLKEVIEILKDGAPDSTAWDDATSGKQLEDDVFRDWWDNLPGNAQAKRALEIAAAGGHPVFIMGAPGMNKIGLARALNEILPPLSKEEQDEVNRIYAATGRDAMNGIRPFRAPHYSSSMAAMFGGGTGDRIAPGEVSLAHNGVLFLDEFNYTPKAAMEFLRAPLEDGKVTISRLKSKVDFPAKFFPVVASLPCPCGYYGEGDKCTCSKGTRSLWLAKLSGPVYDRLTVQIWVHADNGPVVGDSREVVAERVRKARERQIERQGKLNDELTSKEINFDSTLDANTQATVERIITGLGLSARSYTRILKIARTIADLEGKENILPQHITEAASFRFLDRYEFWEHL